MDKILQLPNEVREKIYNHLPQKEALNLRQVSKLLQEEIDTLYNFNLILTDLRGMTPTLMESLFKLRFKSCKVFSLFAPLPTPLGLKYPGTVKYLSIKIDRDLSPLNFYTLMRELSPWIEILHCELAEEPGYSQSQRMKHPEQYNFKNLEILSITHSTSYQYEPKDKWDTEIFNFILSGAVGSKLKSLSIDASWITDNESLCNLFALIGIQSKTLKRFRYFSPTLGPGTNYTNRNIQSKPSTIDLVLNKANCLEQIDMDLNGSDLNLNYDLCLGLLQKQTKLKILKLTLAYDNFQSLIPFTLESIDFSQIILNNAKLTYVNVDLKYPTGNAGINIDFSVFTHCLNLKTLKICNMADQEDFPLVQNFDLLPTSIQALEFYRVNFLSAEMERYFSQDLKFLKTLKILTGSVTSPYKLTQSIVEKIMILPNILKIDLKYFNHLTPFPKNMKLFMKIVPECFCNDCTNRGNQINWHRVSNDMPFKHGAGPMILTKPTEEKKRNKRSHYSKPLHFARKHFDPLPPFGRHF